MKTLKEIHDYWLDPPDGGNKWQTYAKKDSPRTNRSQFLVGLVEKMGLPEDATVLELGCNVCRNLHYLHQRFPKFDLVGVDINKQALENSVSEYPDLSGVVRLALGNIQQFLKDTDERPDLIFTMAVLEHIHPSEAGAVFNDMVRVTKKYILTLEDEVVGNTGRHFPRNYKEVFESRGMKQEYEIQCDWDNHGLGIAFKARLFSKGDAE